MTSLRPFSMFDLLKFNNVNLDLLTETYNNRFYGKYLSEWPEYCVVAESASGKIQGYLLGKVEGDKEDEQKKDWHSHITAVTVAPTFRRQGLAKALMKHMEDVSNNKHEAYFCDLFVRQSNEVAIGMYKNMGYDIYRTVQGYYSSKDSEEDAYDMRKSLKKDVTGVTSRPTGQTIQPAELEFS